MLFRTPVARPRGERTLLGCATTPCGVATAWRLGSRCAAISQRSETVSKLALEHGLNVNMVFRWRRMLRAGQFGAPHVGDAPVLFPVVDRGSGVEASSEASPTGVIRLQLAKGQVSIEGRVDPDVLRMVVQCLS